MTTAELLETLHSLLLADADADVAHRQAEDALLDCIFDADIRAAYNAVPR